MASILVIQKVLLVLGAQKKSVEYSTLGMCVAVCVYVCVYVCLYVDAV